MIGQTIITLQYKWINIRLVSFSGMVDNLSPTTNGGTGHREIYQWYPQSILCQPYKCGKGHGCIVLNREIKIPPCVVKQLWENGKEVLQ